MTIYTSTTVEKKDNSNVEQPQVILDDVPDLQFKTKTSGTDEVDAFLQNNPANEALLLALRRRRRRNALYLLFLLAAALVLALGVISAMKLYGYYHSERVYSNWCGVTSIDEEKHYYEFQEHVQTDARRYEQIEVPQIENFNKAVILHDFEVNFTAIVDREQERCFIKPLNRSLVKPPRDFWDLISKLRSGYYLPDEEEVREDFRIVEPALYDLRPYGPYIWMSCHSYTAYRLEKVQAGLALVKRSICETFRTRHSAGKVVDVINIIQC